MDCILSTEKNGLVHIEQDDFIFLDRRRFKLTGLIFGGYTAVAKLLKARDEFDVVTYHGLIRISDLVFASLGIRPLNYHQSKNITFIATFTQTDPCDIQQALAAHDLERIEAGCHSMPKRSNIFTHPKNTTKAPNNQAK